MKLNVSFPATGSQKLFEIDDEKKLRIFYEKRMGQEIPVDSLGDEWKGYILRIAGGNDKQGFPMKQGVLTNNRVRLLLSKGHSCYRPRRTGERKRKSVRGCIVDSNLSVLALVVVRRGEKEIEGLTDKTVPRRLGPKRASKIRKLFNLDKKDDVRRYVIKRPLALKEGKTKQKTKAPKIQRLITPSVLMHRRHKKAVKRLRREHNKDLKTEYAKLLAMRIKEAREKKQEEQRRRRSSMRESKSSSRKASASAPEPEQPTKAGAKKAAVAKVAAKSGKKETVKPAIKLAGAATAKAAAATAKKPAAAPSAKAKAPTSSKAAPTKAKAPTTAKAAPTKAKAQSSAKAAPAKKEAPAAKTKAAPKEAAKSAPAKKTAAPAAAPKKQAAPAAKSKAAAPAKKEAPAAKAKPAPKKEAAKPAAPKKEAPKPAPKKDAPKPAPKKEAAKPKPSGGAKAAPKPAAAPKKAKK